MGNRKRRDVQSDMDLRDLYEAISANYVESDAVLNTIHGRLRIRYIQDILRELIEPNSLVLDIGCSDGYVVMPFAKRKGTTIGLDLGSVGLKRGVLRAEKVNGNMRWILGDAQGLPFHSETFDIVIALEVLEHLLQPRFALEEISRVLKPGGLFLLTVPNSLGILKKDGFSDLDKIRDALRKRISMIRDETLSTTALFSSETELQPTDYFHRQYSLLEMEELLPKSLQITDKGTVGFFPPFIGRLETLSFAISRCFSVMPIFRNLGAWLCLIAKKMPSGGNKANYQTKPRMNTLEK